MGFIDDDYLLETDHARVLYEEIADLPIVDPHTHADVREIVENEGWDDIWEVEGATDHYVWALMRNRGIPERLITGDASNREKWDALASVFPAFAGNPTYEWVHLDLKRRFGIEEPISAETADAIWEETTERLAEESMRPQALLREMGVEVLCSTDDPTSSLEHHDRAAEEIEDVTVLPTWRADRALAVGTDDWDEFRAELASATGVSCGDLAGFREALRVSHDYFAERGCVASDVGVRIPVSRPVDDARARECYDDALAGSIDETAAGDLQASLLEHVGELNAEKGWTTQFHVGAVRNYRESVHEELGPASGADVSTQAVDVGSSLRHFLNRFDGAFETVLYALDPTHYPTVATLARVFPSVNVGPAWWFNDSSFGIESHLEYVGTVELLSNSPGMVSDSRKLLSYGSRFEMFRRSLSNVLGRQVARGQVPIGVASDVAHEVVDERPRGVYGI